MLESLSSAFAAISLPQLLLIAGMALLGIDIWTNVVTACRRCNNQKASRTPEQAKMQLIAVPFTPTYAEYIFLKGRRVLADQMEYLLAHFPRSSPLHDRIQRWLS